MPLFTASSKHQWTKQPPYNFYHFPEEHRQGWEQFWEEMNGDMEKIISFAKTANIEDPNEWYESLHRFLFNAYCGNPKILKSAAAKSFDAFVKSIAQNHTNNPKPREWYTVRGITVENFISMLERAAEIKDIRQIVGFINARVRDLGFHLYSEFLLSKTKGKSKIKSVASDLNKEAYEIECNAYGASPLEALTVGNTVTHSLFPDEHFMLTDIIRKDDESIHVLVARDSKGKVAFIPDLWNVRRL
jgi:hypothetical protein